MAGNYEKGMYNQLMEVMARLDHVERESRHEISKLNLEISDLKKENQELRKENQLLKDDNARLKSIINNDSSNTSLPPSTDQKGGNLPIHLTAGRKRNAKPADKKGIKELP